MASCVPGNGYAAVLVAFPEKTTCRQPQTKDGKTMQDLDSQWFLVMEIIFQSEMYAVDLFQPRAKYPRLGVDQDHCQLQIHMPQLPRPWSILDTPSISGNKNNPSFTKLYLSFYSTQYITGSTHIYICYMCTYIYIYCYRCYIYIISFTLYII